MSKIGAEMRAMLVRKLGLTVVMMLGLTVAMPLGQDHPARSRFPLAGFWEVLTTRPAWSYDPPSTPKQERGGPVDVSGVIAADRTTANGGSGHRPGRGVGELGEYSPPKAPRPGTSTTGLAYTGFDAASSKRVATGATKATDLFRNADGSYTRRVSPQPVNFKRADGTWQPIDPALVPDAGRLRPTASGIQVSLAGRSDSGFGAGRAAGAGGPVELASLTLPAGEVFGYRLEGAKAVDPVVKGSTAVYREVLPGTDVELTVFGSGRKETLVLRAKSAVNSWVFPLRLRGLRAVLTDRGPSTGSC